MKSAQACLHIIAQLVHLVEQIDEGDFSRPSATLNNHTLGQHVRHTLEFFFCFEKGCETGVINYDKRSHDKLIESDKFIALNALNHIRNFVSTADMNMPLKLEVAYDTHDEVPVSMETNVMRELVYNIEHAVHHMAIIKIGLAEVAPYVTLPPDFGVAASTVRYKQATEKASQ